MTLNRSKKSSAFSKSKPHSNTHVNLKITLLGDSTIDNKIWVHPGLYGNAMMNQFDIHGASPRTRVKRSHGLFGKWVELSVVENLMDMLPNCNISDYTNDGFTTRDVLKGNHKDKVFPTGVFREFPHDMFQPLEAGKTAIQDADYIILSVGGNNFREFLQQAHGIPSSEERKQHIQQHFPLLVEKTKNEYIKLLNKIFGMNPNASLVLMTQYYPSFKQNNYHIYEFMHDVGNALYPEDQLSPEDVIHRLVQNLYTGILAAVQPYAERLIIADLSSSLNPFDEKNHVMQIEPSGVGGKQIASMLTYLITKNIERGYVYQFNSGFFTLPNAANADQHVIRSALEQWVPKHPNDFEKPHAVKSCQLL